MKQLITGCILMLAAGVSAGQIMECIDAKGAKTMAQFCPPGTVKENKLMQGGVGTGNSGAAAKSMAERDAEFKKRSIERQEAEAKGAKEKSEDRKSVV